MILARIPDGSERPVSFGVSMLDFLAGQDSSGSVAPGSGAAGKAFSIRADLGVEYPHLRGNLSGADEDEKAAPARLVLSRHAESGDLTRPLSSEGARAVYRGLPFGSSPLAPIARQAAAVAPGSTPAVRVGIVVVGRCDLQY